MNDKEKLRLMIEYDKIDPIVDKFAKALKLKLRSPKNLKKGSWLNSDYDYLFNRTIEELKELRELISKKSNPFDVIQEAIDVMAFAMFIADKYQYEIVKEGAKHIKRSFDYER